MRDNEEFPPRIITKATGHWLTESNIEYISLREHSALISEKEKEIERLREALENAAGALSIRADDIEHYFENQCLPTKDEVYMAKSAYKDAKQAISVYARRE